jgi:hypothetical protein
MVQPPGQYSFSARRPSGSASRIGLADRVALATALFAAAALALFARAWQSHPQ